MSKVKKILLSTSLLLGILIALVIGLVGIKDNKDAKGDFEKKYKRPPNIFYPGEVTVTKGLPTLEYSYNPNATALSSKAVAYEYVFIGTMSTTSVVNLKSISTDKVKISYAYRSGSPIDFDTETITTEKIFTAQELAINGEGQTYVYIIVEPTGNNTLPVDYSTSIVWYQGRPKTIKIFDNVTQKETKQVIVDGQDTLPTPKVSVPDGYYFDAWFLDKEFTQLVEGEPDFNRPMYARYHNIKPNVTDYMTFENGGYTLSQESITESIRHEDVWYDDYGNKYSDTWYEEVIVGLPEDLVIPTIYNDGVNGEAKVLSIAEDFVSMNSMNGDHTFSSITLPCSLVSIGANAFLYYGTSGVDFTSCVNLTTIGSSAFNECMISSIDLTNCKKLTTIGGYAFEACSEMSEVFIPKSVISIGDRAFATGVSFNMEVDDKNPVYTDGDCNALIEKATKTLLYAYDNSTIPDYIEHIKDLGTYAYSKTSLTIPNNVKTLESVGYAFDLTTVVLPSGLQEIGSYAFGSCYALNTINLEDTSLTTIGEGAFQSCTALTSVSLPATVTSIGEGAFEYSGVRTVSIADENTVYNDGNSGVIIETATNRLIQAFASSTIPNSVEILGPGSMTLYSKTTITLPTSLKVIEDKAFYSCSQITTITFPSTLQSIGEHAFYNCYSLTSVKLQDTQVTNIENYAFGACSRITSVTLPSTLTSIGNYAFLNCSLLNNINLQNSSVTNIGEYAFAGCSKLVSVTMPSTLTEIGTYAFSGCSSLTSANMQNSSLETIDDYAFYNCTKLASATFPSTLQYLGGSAFYQCKALTSVDLQSTNITVIKGYTFYYCSALATVKLPSSVQEIHSNAFYSCSALTSVAFNLNGESGTQWYYKKYATSDTLGTAFVDSADGATLANYLKGTGKSYYLYDSNEVVE